jgi:hypothetical protein
MEIVIARGCDGAAKWCSIALRTRSASTTASDRVVSRRIYTNSSPP